MGKSGKYLLVKRSKPFIYILNIMLYAQRTVDVYPRALRIIINSQVKF